MKIAFNFSKKVESEQLVEMFKYIENLGGAQVEIDDDGAKSNLQIVDERK